MTQTFDVSAFYDSFEFEIPPVSGTIVDRAGRVVEISGEVWTFDDDHGYIRLDWGSLPISDGAFRRSMQHYVADAAGSQAPRSLGNAFNTFKHCLKLVPDSFWQAGHDASPLRFEDRTSAWLRNVVASLRAKNRLWRLQIVRQWYTYCVELWQDLGFSAETALMLDGIQIPNNPTGINVHSLLPDVGPLTSQEMQALVMALEADECHQPKSIQERAAVTLCMAFGRNTRSFCLLLEGHFWNACENTAASDEGWLVDIPRIKKPNTRHGRHKLSQMYCIPEVMKPVLALIAKNSAMNLSVEDRPLFLNERVLSGELKASSLTALCMASIEFAGLLRSFVSRLRVPSRVDGKLLHLTPRRLRYTLGTTLARMGKSREELAELLDHSDTKTVEVYYSFGEDMLEVLDKALEDKGSTLLGYFNRVTSKSELTVDGRHRWVVTLTPDDVKRNTTVSDDDDGGGCSLEEEQCTKDVPVACYGCPKYQPFVEGPHHLVLAIVDKRIASYAHMKRVQDELITVRNRIEFVIKLCEQYQREHPESAEPS